LDDTRGQGDGSQKRSSVLTIHRTPSTQIDDGWAWRSLIVLAAGQGMLYAVIAWLSRRFVYGEGFEQRPLLTVIGLFAAGFVLYAASTFLALRIHAGRRLGGLIVLAAVGFRGILLFSQPIQEIDVYRYLWDGAVAAQGVSPYRYAPAEVLSAAPSESLGDPFSAGDLSRLARRRDASPAINEILHRVHYPELTTVYPPVSQAVFAFSVWLTPADASVDAHVTAMKSVLLIFDLATIALVWLLLRAAGKHPAWVIAYAWCPLVMKEFANSGHLDSIAVCLTTAAIYCGMRPLVSAHRHQTCWWTASAMCLALAVGAKLYPVVLVPLMSWAAVRKSGVRGGVLFSGAVLVMSGVCLAPMFWPVAFAGNSTPTANRDDASASSSESASWEADSGEAAVLHRSPSGLAAFLSRWEMNDFLFLIVVENLRPPGAKPDQPPPWFAVVPGSWRTRVVSDVAGWLSKDINRTTFLLARVITAAAYLGIVLYLLFRLRRSYCAIEFLEATFLTLAWFWLLSPTQNPWYWIWALPLLPLARGRAWFMVSGLVFVYYLRFWFLYHWPGQTVFGTVYNASEFFDFVLTWVEFGPWFLWLAAETMLRRRFSGKDDVLPRDASKRPSVFELTD